MENEEWSGTDGLSVPYEEGDIIMAWFNTRIRIFKDPAFNHVEWTTPEGKLKGIRVAQFLMDFLFEHEFPYSFDPEVDQETKDWWENMETKNLDDEIGDFFAGGF